MTKTFLAMLCAVVSMISVAQKPAIDLSMLGKWPYVENAKISNDGKFVMYTISNSLRDSNVLVIAKSFDKWKREIADATSADAFFADDSKKVYFRNRSDSLGIFSLEREKIEYIPSVGAFELAEHINRRWLLYVMKDSSRSLVLRDLHSGEIKTFINTNNYLFSADKQILLVQQLIDDKHQLYAVHWINLLNGSEKQIWQGSKATGFSYDSTHDRVAFQTQQAIRIFDAKNNTVDSLLYNNMQEGFALRRLHGFSADGERLFITLRKLQEPAQKHSVSMQVWSYLDEKLPSEFPAREREYIAVVLIKERRMFMIEQEHDQVTWEDPSVVNPGDWKLVLHYRGDITNEGYWNRLNQPTINIVSAKTGERRLIKDRETPEKAFSYRMAPGGKFVLYYDPDTKSHHSYEIATGQCRQVSDGIDLEWTLEKENESISKPSLAAWFTDEDAALVYDAYDVWKIDLTGRKAPVNMTHGYGREHLIRLRFMRDYGDLAMVNRSSSLLMCAFNFSAAKNGIFRVNLAKPRIPEQLFFSKHLYYSPDVSYGSAHWIAPVKSRDANVYLFRRESEREFPNYFVTKDFKTIHAVTNFQPQHSYNWLTSEVIAWTLPDGRPSQGVLYKPENFDSSKKYPVIFYYYEQLSDQANIFRYPEASERINVPYFVSNGYLVFYTDIHYTPGHTGESAVAAVTSAAKRLMQFSYVDSSRMGLQGHSFGGYQTNYIVSQTKMFAAACAAAGMSNLLSNYGHLQKSGHSNMSFYENGQGRMKYTFWERPNLYIQNSPYFFADKVSTPLLLMHNQLDNSGATFSQGTEWFTALRRLGKKVWLLQYDDQYHWTTGAAGMDFTIRMKQFFDHYLKGAPAPRWMTRGADAENNPDYEYEFDKEISTPREGLLMDADSQPSNQNCP